MKILWVMGVIDPNFAGGATVYSIGLLEALARAGAEVRVLVRIPPELEPGCPSDLATWHLVEAEALPAGRARFHSLPYTASANDVPAMLAQLRSLLDDFAPDLVVLDNYAAIWALSSLGNRPFVYIAHNFERRLAIDIAWAQKGRRKLMHAANAWRIARSERRLVRRSRLTVAICEADKRDLARWKPAADILVCTPGHAPANGPLPPMTDATPRRIALFGAMHWQPKQLNVAAFLEEADARLAAAGIETIVIGSGPPDFMEKIRRHDRSTRILGYVADPLPLLQQCRLGLVIEAVGGGFKLKSLDYIFAGLPMIALAGSLDGLPPDLADQVVFAPDLPSVVDAVIARIDDLAHLNASRAAALAIAGDAFDWRERGTRLKDAIASRLG